MDFWIPESELSGGWETAPWSLIFLGEDRYPDRSLHRSLLATG